MLKALAAVVCMAGITTQLALYWVDGCSVLCVIKSNKNKKYIHVTALGSILNVKMFYSVCSVRIQ